MKCRIFSKSFSTPHHKLNIANTFHNGNKLLAAMESHSYISFHYGN